jgi:hypothetical protein
VAEPALKEGKMKFANVVLGLLAAAATLSACDDNSTPGGPDFGRALEPGEYQVSVTGDVQRSFESTGARYEEFATPPSTFDGTHLRIWDDLDALNGAEFVLCVRPVQGEGYHFDADVWFATCPSDAGNTAGGFIVQLGAPQADELDCSGSSYGDKEFTGTLVISSISGSDIEGEAYGTGTCSRHPHSEIVPMGSENVTVHVRFRAVKQAT